MSETSLNETNPGFNPQVVQGPGSSSHPTPAGVDSQEESSADDQIRGWISRLTMMKTLHNIETRRLQAMTTWILTIQETEIADQYEHYWEPCNPAGKFQKNPMVGDMLVVIYEGARDEKDTFKMCGLTENCPFHDDEEGEENIFETDSLLNQFCFARRIEQCTNQEPWTFSISWKKDPLLQKSHCVDPKMIVTTNPPGECEE